MRLARKMILVTLSALLVVFGVLGYLDTRRLVREYQDRVAADLSVSGRAVAPMLAEVSTVEGPARARQLLDRFAANRSDVRMRWLATNAPELRFDEGDRRKLASGEDVVKRNGRLVVYVPVESGASVLETRRTMESSQAFERAIVLRRMSIVLLAGLVAALVASLAAIGLIGTPMRRLTIQARRVGGGDFSRRLRLRRSDEIGVLAGAMDNMCDQLDAARRHAEDEATAKVSAERQVRHADKMSTVGTLAAGMAHELGTPLNVIGGRAKMITTVPGTPPEAVKYAEIIGAQAARMRNILRGLLDFARRTPTVRQPTDLSGLAERVVDLLQPLASKHEVVLTCAAEPGAGAPPLDSGQVEQALVNVVVNGIQAMNHPGTVATEVHRVRARAPGSNDERDWVCVSVRDEGQGISEDEIGHLFEPFFTTKAVGEGTGLGLAVTYGIVRDHGGFIDVHSTKGRGTNVSLYLPA